MRFSNILFRLSVPWAQRLRLLHRLNVAPSPGQCKRNYQEFYGIKDFAQAIRECLPIRYD